MDASVEAVYGDKVLKSKNFLLEEWVNDSIANVPQNFIYKVSVIVGEGHVSNRVKYVINLSSDGTSKVSDTNQFKWLDP